MARDKQSATKILNAFRALAVLYCLASYSLVSNLAEIQGLVDLVVDILGLSENARVGEARGRMTEERRTQDLVAANRVCYSLSSSNKAPKYGSITDVSQPGPAER